MGHVQAGVLQSSSAQSYRLSGHASSRNWPLNTFYGPDGLYRGSPDSTNFGLQENRVNRGLI